MEAMRELERVRAFAEQSEEQRGEVIAAAKSAAEVLAKHEAASGEQAAALEMLDERAQAAEAEARRLGHLLADAAEEREALVTTGRSEAAGSPPPRRRWQSSPAADAARDEVANITRAEHPRRPRRRARGAAAEARVGASTPPR